MPKAFYYVLALIIIGLDQYTKVLAVNNLTFAISEPVNSFLNWTLLYNRGAAFSFLSDAGGWQQWLLGGLAGAVSIGIVIYIWCLSKAQVLLSLALAFVLGGALGNLYDRVTLGYFVDFIDVYLNECGMLEKYFYACHWPVFNIADSAIVLGAILLLIESFFPQIEEEGKSE